jgi:hypothetical protein
MARFHGPIGYAIPTEIRPGVWKDQIEEHTHSGDVTRNSARWNTSSDSTNDDLTVSNQFSIVADPFAWSNFHTMKYVRYMGTNWKITSIEERYPRLILTVGGKYNGPAISGA